MSDPGCTERMIGALKAVLAGVEMTDVDPTKTPTKDLPDAILAKVVKNVTHKTLDSVIKKNRIEGIEQTATKPAKVDSIYKWCLGD